MCQDKKKHLVRPLMVSVKWWFVKVEVVVTATEEEDEYEGESQ